MIFSFKQLTSQYAKPPPLFPQTKQNVGKTCSSIFSERLHGKREFNSFASFKHFSSMLLKKYIFHVGVQDCHDCVRGNMKPNKKTRLFILAHGLALLWNELDIEYACMYL
jgi:hypothetical protein